MRDFDLNGLRLATYQAKIFEESVSLNCSTPIFLRRYFNSSFIDKLDRGDSSLLTLCTIDAFNELEEEFGEFNYGRTKENKDKLFYLGYILRYICYTRNVTTKVLLHILDYQKILSSYEVFHTQDNEYVLKSILEMNNLTDDIFDKNKRLKDRIKAAIVEI